MSCSQTLFGIITQTSTSGVWCVKGGGGGYTNAGMSTARRRSETWLLVAIEDGPLHATWLFVRSDKPFRWPFPSSMATVGVH